MKIKVVSRDQVRSTRGTGSKFKPLLDILATLPVNGDAVEVHYGSDSELNSLRNIVYTFAREQGMKVKSGKDAVNKRIFFYKV